MTLNPQQKTYWVSCKNCGGLGKKRRKPRKKDRQRFQKEYQDFIMSDVNKNKPIKPKGSIYDCPICKGNGIITSTLAPTINPNFPHVCIIGAGIGGVALALSLFQRGIPFTLFEKDQSFNSRSQGYGLTLQQASKALKRFGITSLPNGINSTKHIVHNSIGEVIGEWGKRKWITEDKKSNSKKSNIHIARQSLRLELLQQLGGPHMVQWDHEFLNCTTLSSEHIEVTFKSQNELKKIKTNLVVGADGIRSKVRPLVISNTKTPLRYLDCMVILGICNLNELKHVNSPLLDLETVFQTANGKERIYVMPFNSEAVMWQLSFPISETKALNLSKSEIKYLKDEAVKRANWHTPIPEIIKATTEKLISGYPVYDRKPLQNDDFKQTGNITLIGDAAHPMSPFKGQGANQALLDALELSATLTKTINTYSNWRDIGLRPLLTKFETNMLKRSAVKVKDSAEAAQALHSEHILIKKNHPRGKFDKNSKNEKRPN